LTLSHKPSNFMKSVRKVINEVKWRSGGNHQKCSEAKWRLVKGSKLSWGSEGHIGVKWNEGKVMVKCKWNHSWQYIIHYCYCLLYSMLSFY
jgi:hypothetical protein